ncbi:MAG TPA: hypothetical protein PLJ21_07935 [Pseudobdellovibrionaceae bacterium]|nr:hypothetical protein [Pseudobdellovibrionaceae bacterium]
MKQIYILMILLSFASVQAETIEEVETFEPQCLWTYNNNQSGAPTPACSCDLNANEKDCFPTLKSEMDPMVALETLPQCTEPLESLKANDSICFDEFIPVGSKWWVHSIVYKFKTGP